MVPDSCLALFCNSILNYTDTIKTNLAAITWKRQLPSITIWKVFASTFVYMLLSDN